jgi:hypothetical protein
MAHIDGVVTSAVIYTSSASWTLVESGQDWRKKQFYARPGWIFAIRAHGTTAVVVTLYFYDGEPTAITDTPKWYMRLPASNATATLSDIDCKQEFPYGLRCDTDIWVAHDTNTDANFALVAINYGW